MGAVLDFSDEFAVAAQWFASHLAHAKMDARVPACPDWSVLDLAVHLGNVHSWAASILETGRAAEMLADEPVSHRPRRVARWYEGRAEDLYAVLRATRADRPCWNFAYGEGVAGFWHRRQAHETLMHGVDLASAAGVPARLPAVLAADGVDEVFSVFLHRMHTRGHPADLSAPLVVRATDAGDAWTLTPVPGDEPRVVRAARPDGAGSGEAPGEASEASRGDLVEAPAGVLLKLLWKRARLDDPDVRAQLRVVGDDERVSTFFAGRLTA